MWRSTHRCGRYFSTHGNWLSSLIFCLMLLIWFFDWQEIISDGYLLSYCLIISPLLKWITDIYIKQLWVCLTSMSIGRWAWFFDDYSIQWLDFGWKKSNAMMIFFFLSWRAYRAKAEVQLMEGRTDEHDRLLFVAWSCMLLNLDNFVIIHTIL